MANLPPHDSPTTEAEVGRRSRNHNQSEGRGGSKGKGISHLPPPGPSASSGTSAAEDAGLGCIMAGSPAAGLSYANIGLSAQRRRDSGDMVVTFGKCHHMLDLLPTTSSGNGHATTFILRERIMRNRQPLRERRALQTRGR